MSSPYTPRGNGGGDVDRAVSDAHADYHREIQQHVEPDGLVDDVVTYRMLAPHLMRTLLFLVMPTVLLLLKAVIDYLAAMSTPDDLTDVVSLLLGLVIVVLYLAGIASFFAPAKEPIAEHARLLENRGDAAGAAFEYVRAAAEARRSPADVHPSSVAGVPVLIFEQYSERAMLLVQPYGRDLYVGWTMWRSRSTATLLLHFLRDTFGRFAPSPRFSAELRAAATRALRESVHSLSREGVAAALNAAPVPAPGPHPYAAGPQPDPDARYGHRAEPHAAPTEANGRSWQAQQPPTGPAGPADPSPSGALPTAGPDEQAWTGGWSATAPGYGDEDLVGARRESPHRETPRRGAGTREADRNDTRHDTHGDTHGDTDGHTDDGWGPPPRDRW
ncbi:hypothetical protein [Actinomycetospora lemnae]|uniref:Uncharacterized protein n=1 Tax=Actinomycetospora lemnae TaxID=3019891 RepID=A0ABT5SVR5_9PSEU|nr:hypothetical protein [Actinomycetospora sp. DW7H6]MDD7966937.1 hypothetical protein [Actinomycetospora sp. DW7H6]